MKKEYKVIHAFKDLKDKNYIYVENNKYPREGLKPGKKRIEELLSDKNKIGKPLIQLIETEHKEEKTENEEKVSE